MSNIIFLYSLKGRFLLPSAPQSTILEVSIEDAPNEEVTAEEQLPLTDEEEKAYQVVFVFQSGEFVLADKLIILQVLTFIEQNIERGKSFINFQHQIVDTGTRAFGLFFFELTFSQFDKHNNIKGRLHDMIL